MKREVCMTRFVSVRKGTFFAALVAVTALWLNIPALLQAQTTGMVVAIPFDFYIGNDKMAAGKYTIVRPSQHVAQVLDANGRSRLILTTPVDNRRRNLNAQVVFNKYNND